MDETRQDTPAPDTAAPASLWPCLKAALARVRARLPWPRPAGAPRPVLTRGQRIRRWALQVGGIALFLALLPFLLTLVYAVVPPVSTLMMARVVTLQPASRYWLPLEKISPTLVRSVVTSEDARFCTHNGVDFVELNKVLAEIGDGGPSRGASTITMQVARNLFLWQGRSYIRKAVEIPIAFWIDFALSKRRVLEIYLNTVEWGPDGQFGAEAGARAAFGRSATDLTQIEAALMATALPNPILRDPANPSAGQRRLARNLLVRVRREGDILGCVGPLGRQASDSPAPAPAAPAAPAPAPTLTPPLPTPAPAPAPLPLLPAPRPPG